ncbi:MAG: hypothetical protein K2Y37_08270 [Pirellulales bacterium]|nr:hypothetical protein [Pirellulales bacterium]
MNSANVTWLADLAVAQLWQVSLLVVLVGLLTRTICRRQPHLAYLLWLVVLAKCLAPPVAASRLSPFSWLLAERSAPLAAAPAVLPAINLAAESATAETTTTPNPPPIAQLSPAAVAIPATSNSTVPAIALSVWAISAVGLAVVVLAKNLQLRSTLRNATEPSDDLARQLASLVARLGMRRSPNLVVTAEPLGPLVFGVLRPTVVLPRAALVSFDGQRRAAAELEPVLAHEVVHVRRGDTFVGLLQMLAQIGWWFHPLVWWANREMRRERERACDEEVVAGLACPPTHYARSLLAVLEAAPCRRSAWAPAGMPMLSFTAQRLAHLVRESATFRKRMPLGYWFVAALLMVLLLPGAGLSLEAPPAGKATEPKQPETAGGTLDLPAYDVIEFTSIAQAREDDEEAQITGQFIANPQTPVPAREVGSDAQRAAVAELEKLGGAAYASRDKSGKVRITIILEASKWKGGSAGLTYLSKIDDLQGVYLACKSVADTGLAPLKALQQLGSLQLDNPSLEQLKSLKDWLGPKGLTIYGDELSDDSLGEIGHWSNLEALTVASDGSRAKPPQPGITDAAVARLKPLTHLKRLQVTGCRNVLGSTLGALSGLADLRMLTLLDTGFDDRGLAELGKLTQVKHLILDVSKISPSGFASLGSMTALTRLSLNEARTFDDAAAAHLVALKNLRALHLFDNKLTDAGLAPLAGLTQLRELQVWKGNFSDAGIAHLRGLTKLRILRIDSENLDVGNDGLRNLAALTALQHLGLHAKRATDEGLAFLAGLTELKYLDLNDAQIRGPGLAHLNRLAKLEHLYLNDTPLADAGLKSLPALAKLKLLSLGDTKLTDAGLAPLAELSQLDTLHLSDTAVTDAGLTTLARIPKLQTLNLSNTKITDAGLEKLAGAKTLRELLISGTQVTAAAKQQFKQKHPEVEFEPVLGLALNTFQIDDEAEEEADAKAAGDTTESGFQLDNP